MDVVLVTDLERNLQKFLSFLQKTAIFLINIFANSNKRVTFVESGSNNAHTYRI